MLTDDNLQPENNPVKHGVTKAEHDQIRDAYFETAKVRQAEADLALVQAIPLALKLKAAGLL